MFNREIDYVTLHGTITDGAVCELKFSETKK
jgi:hypothetical protein